MYCLYKTTMSTKNINFLFKNIGAICSLGKYMEKKRYIKGFPVSRILAKVPFKLRGKLQVQLPPVAETIGRRNPVLKHQTVMIDTWNAWVKLGSILRFSWMHIVVKSLIELEGFGGPTTWIWSWPATYEGKPFISKCLEEYPPLCLLEERWDNVSLFFNVISEKLRLKKYNIFPANISSIYFKKKRTRLKVFYLNRSDI